MDPAVEAIRRRVIERTLRCPNPWHRSAPARAELTCPECPKDAKPEPAQS